MADKKPRAKRNSKVVEEIILEETIQAQEVETTSGIGDVIASVTDFLGITKCDECEERRKKLNKMFPFTKNARTIENEDDKEFIANLKDRGKLTKEEVERIMRLMKDVFGMRVKFCNCPALFKGYIEKLKVQLEYQSIDND